ncbi:MAG: potassium channel protein [Phycisphaerales bacterium]|nr:potassium channel protein [Phycisphaerales bacterium]NNM25715.1 potassium channel protein [Phycisphaerales bacterium]
MFIFRGRGGKRNLRVLLRFVAVLVGLVVLYSVVFHYIMEMEGHEHSWMTGFYWTLTVMSTLGFGDITFESDIGRLFSTVVLLSGIVFLLILLPFTIIQFFYAPWIESQAAARTPKELPDAAGHVILTNHDVVSAALIRKLQQFNYDYVLLVPNPDEAARLHDLSLNVAVGDLDDPQTYERVRADRAALVATTHNDFVNTHVVFTVRGLSPNVPIVATANAVASVDIIERAGATQVLHLGEQMGQALTRCISGGDAVTHVVGNVDELLIAEANAARTPMVGKTIRENRLREIGVTVLGIWDRGHFQPATADSVVGPNSILLLAGSATQFERYDEEFVIYNVSVDPIVILGGGRVGRAAARMLSTRNIDWRIVEQVPGRAEDADRTIVGDAADHEVLARAGVQKAPAVLITTHDDDLNVYLAIYCRSLRPDMQIITRVTRERNVAAMHRAGADFVLSYASMGATSMFNLIRRSRIVSIAEGLEVFRVPVPAGLVGKSIAGSGVREETGCTIAAVRTEDGLQINPPAAMELAAGGELILVGSPESEGRFLERFAGE